MAAVLYLMREEKVLTTTEIWISKNRESVLIYHTINMEEYSDFLLDNINNKDYIISSFSDFGRSGEFNWGGEDASIEPRNITKHYNNCLNSYTKKYNNRVKKLGLILKIDHHSSKF